MASDEVAIQLNRALRNCSGLGDLNMIFQIVKKSGRQSLVDTAIRHALNMDLCASDKERHLCMLLDFSVSAKQDDRALEVLQHWVTEHFSTGGALPLGRSFIEKSVELVNRLLRRSRDDLVCSAAEVLVFLCQELRDSQTMYMLLRHHVGALLKRNEVNVARGLINTHKVSLVQDVAWLPSLLRLAGTSGDSGEIEELLSVDCKKVEGCVSSSDLSKALCDIVEHLEPRLILLLLSNFNLEDNMKAALVSLYFRKRLAGLHEGEPCHDLYEVCHAHLEVVLRSDQRDWLAVCLWNLCLDGELSQETRFLMLGDLSVLLTDDEPTRLQCRILQMAAAIKLAKKGEEVERWGGQVEAAIADSDDILESLPPTPQIGKTVRLLTVYKLTLAMLARSSSDLAKRVVNEAIRTESIETMIAAEACLQEAETANIEVSKMRSDLVKAALREAYKKSESTDEVGSLFHQLIRIVASRSVKETKRVVEEYLTYLDELAEEEVPQESVFKSLQFLFNLYVDNSGDCVSREAASNFKNMAKSLTPYAQKFRAFFDLKM